MRTSYKLVVQGCGSRVLALVNSTYILMVYCLGVMVIILDHYIMTRLRGGGFAEEIFIYSGSHLFFS